MLSKTELTEILNNITYKQCRDGTDTVTAGFDLGHDGNNAWWIQHWQWVPDCRLVHNLESEKRGCKWRVSKHATISEVIQTALAAVLAFEEHEARKGFKYLGHPLFHPHVHYESLCAAAMYRDKRLTPEPEQECSTCGTPLEGCCPQCLK